MPFDQVKHPKLDVSGSEPIVKPHKAPPPAPKAFTVSEHDDSIVRLAHDLNAEKDKLNAETQVQGRQAGFTRTSVEEVVKQI